MPTAHADQHPGISDLGPQVRALVVDGDEALIHLVSIALHHEGWQVCCARDGATARRMAPEFVPHLVVLDTVLPDQSGRLLLRELRRRDPGLPALFLASDAGPEPEDVDRTRPSEQDADVDWLAKPCNLEEVVQRLRELLWRSRRTAARDDESLLVVGDLTLDEDNRLVTRGGQRIDLTATEFELLRELMHNARRVLSKKYLLSQIWPQQAEGDERENRRDGRRRKAGNTNIVELYISYLRKKIDAGRQPMIHTMRGAGYVLRPAR
ncbi:MAG TPA: response regulator transcription factor [Pseudonocardiaceae bacterium]